MTNWEYTWIGVSNNAHEMWRDGEQIFKSGHVLRIVDYMNQLGNEGWELTGVSNPITSGYEAMGGTTLYFKRQKS